MAKEFRRGKDLIQAAAEGKSNKPRFSRNIYWKNGDVHTLAWITGADEIPKVRLHQMVRIPDDTRESGFRYDTFLCKKDPSMVEESGGVCPLCDDIGHEPTERWVALAVELEPERDGKRIKSLSVKTDKVTRDDGTEVEYPRWGIVTQGAKNFFSYFAAYDEAQGDIREEAWEITREGDGVGTKYHSFAIKASLPDLSEVVDNIPGLYDILEDMGTDEKYEAVAELEPGSQPSFGPKKVESGTVPSGSRQSEFERMREQVVGSY